MSKVYTNEELSQKIDALSEIVNDKVDRDCVNTDPSQTVLAKTDFSNVTPYLQKRYVTNGVTVEIWSDGYCTQRGKTWMESYATFQITLPVAYKDVNYWASGLPFGGINTEATRPQLCLIRSIDSNNKMTLTNGENSKHMQWETKGYIR